MCGVGRGLSPPRCEGGREGGSHSTVWRGGEGRARPGLEGHLASSEEGGMGGRCRQACLAPYLRPWAPRGPWKPEAGPLESVKSDSL